MDNEKILELVNSTNEIHKKKVILKGLIKKFEEEFIHGTNESKIDIGKIINVLEYILNQYENDFNSILNYGEDDLYNSLLNYINDKNSLRNLKKYILNNGIKKENILILVNELLNNDEKIIDMSLLTDNDIQDIAYFCRKSFLEIVNNSKEEDLSCIEKKLKKEFLNIIKTYSNNAKSRIKKLNLE